MRIGRMDERVTIQEVTETKDAMGDTVEAWTDQENGERWAEVIREGGGERVENGRTVAVHRFRVRIRYDENLTTKNRLMWRGRTLEITSVADGVDERKRQHMTDVLCVETA